MNTLAIVASSYLVFTAGFGNLLNFVAVIGDPDRRTEVEFAKESNVALATVQQRYAATGIIRCGADRGTANLALTGNLVVTSAHMFVDRKTCSPVTAPQRCTVQFDTNKETFEKRVLGVLRIGFRCPTIPRITDDWAILKIENAPPIVKAYAISKDQTSNTIQLHNQITFIGGMSADFVRKSQKGDTIHPKHFGRCRIEKLYLKSARPVLFASSCDNGVGASGAAILDDTGDQPILIGIHQGNSESPAQLQQAITRGSPNTLPYQENRWSSYHVPLVGDFLNALISAERESRN